MKRFGWAAVAAVLFAILAVFPEVALAHCDTMNGPVVKAARKALEANDVNLVLVWVQKKDEAEIRKAFARTMTVRKLSEEAKALADMYFFETLVRIHRAGEGEPYTGLKPADAPVDPGIEAADRALEKGSPEELVQHASQVVHEGIRKRFAAADKAKKFKPENLEAGRAYVKSYVEFIHYVERVHQAAGGAEGEHSRGAEKEPGGHH